MKQFVLIFLASTGFAVLPPYHQRVKEIQMLVTDPRLYERLAPEMITDITRTEKGYQIQTQSYVLDIDIHYGGDMRIIGPAQFQFEFFEPRIKGTF